MTGTLVYATKEVKMYGTQSFAEKIVSTDNTLEDFLV